MRVKLAARGGGRWQSSGGFRSKFGLTVTEIMRGLEELKARGMQDCLKLLHFHLGSQITNIRIVKGALNEAARVYAELAKLGAGLQYLDVGGGLGVDYDGSQTNFESSMNYTLEEYANDVVYHIQTVCDEAGVPHPTIVSESGRAIVAYHSVLVFNVLGVSGFGDEKVPTTANPGLGAAARRPDRDLPQRHARNALEAFHDAQQALDMALNLFNGGYLPLEQRSLAENLFWAICTKLQKIVQTMAEVPEDLQNLDEQLSDTYFCNFSLFQSIPDSWAIKQLFPVMPIHRLEREADATTRCSATSPATPTARSITSSIAATSRRRCRCTRSTASLLPRASSWSAPIRRSSATCTTCSATRTPCTSASTRTASARLDALIKGDTVREVLDYVEFDAEMLLGKLRTDVETAVRDGRDRLRGRRPAAALLRRRAARLHLPRRLNHR